MKDEKAELVEEFSAIGAESGSEPLWHHDHYRCSRRGRVTTRAILGNGLPN
jgi:hypothetical protein